MIDGQHIPQEDLALYAMQALAPAESTAVQIHLDGCAPCRSELAEQRGDLSALALGVEQHQPPAGARARFLTRLAEQPRPASERQLNVVSDRTHRKTFSGMLPWAALAAMLAVAAYLGVKNYTLEKTLQNDRSQIASLSKQAAHAQAFIYALTSPTAQRATLTAGKPVTTPTGHTSYAPERGALIFIANHLHPVPASKTYELWIIPANGSAPIPAGTFRPDSNGTASVILPPLPQGVPAKAFGVTIENEGGATTPTLPIILSGS